MVRDKSTYGFSKSDAAELIQLIGSTDRSYREGLVRGGGGNGARLFRFTLNEDMGFTSPGRADADILDAETGADTGIDADVTDALAIFSILENGDDGWCLRQGEIYYVIQAPCAGDSTISGGVL